MFEKFNLTGKVAIVTGGAGGLGKTISMGLAQHGADVVVTSRTMEKLEPVAKRIQALGRKSLAVTSDVTDEKSVAAMVDRVVKEFSHIDILVNAAGMIIRAQTESIAMADWKKVMEFNAMGTFICCQKVGQVMINQKKGKIVNVSSVRGAVGAPIGAAAYSPSKGAVDAMTRNIAVEWAKFNIYVNAIAPTVIHTELTEGAMKNPDWVKFNLSRIPLNRFGEPDDLIGPVVFLASDASNFITGQILYVDGGSTIG
jgi:NAD(P)-dependent dehydrogenase (short-subunit alcohol dehydrogenase family)